MQKKKYMRRALNLAKKAKGKVSPNPLVGCVIVKNGKIIGEGFHQKFGQAHAEINALQNASEKTQGAEMYVNLEPCCHFGKTPPCTEAILKAGICKVHIAMLDPNPLVSGKGRDFLLKNKIEVSLGLEKKQAEKLNEKFIYHIQNKKIFVALKLATTLDGKITRIDKKQWITNQKSRYKVHQLRNEYDAILVGKNTVSEDNPSLTPYLLKKSRNPLRIILDSNLTLPIEKKVFADSHFVIATKSGHNFSSKAQYLKKGGEILEIETDNSQIDLKKLLFKLEKMGISSLLIEGGSQVFTNFLNQNLVQKLYWFQAPLITGKEALSGIDKLQKIQFLQNLSLTQIDDNFLIEGYFNEFLSSVL